MNSSVTLACPLSDKNLNAAIAERMQRNTGPQYCQNIAAAWYVVEEMFKRGWDAEIQGFSDPEGKLQWRCRMAKIERQHIATLAFSESAPRAICEAALAATSEVFA